MLKWLLVLFLLMALMITLTGGSCSYTNGKRISMAVEFNNHAACAYVAQAKGWFNEQHLSLIPIFQVYQSGTAIAVALARGDVQIGYMGLTAAILTYAQGVPIKIVSGVHRHGYGLLVRPELERADELQNKTIGCLREGTVTDLLLNLMIEKYHLQNLTIMRMSPSEGVIALTGGRVDAAFLPEPYATMAESKGFRMLIDSQDLWPDMQGDVLVVREELMQNNPEVIANLVKVSKEATAWVNEHPKETAEIVARELQIAGEKILSLASVSFTADLEITPEIILRSMSRMEYSASVNAAVVQSTIDYMVRLGYVKGGFNASDILDFDYLQKEGQEDGR